MSLRILIADDSLTVRMDLEDSFREAGFETTACSNIAEARRALSQKGHDLLVLDIVFPDGNGIDFLHELRSAPQPVQTPVIFLSSQAEVADRIRGLQAGAHDYAGKPYDKVYLVSRARDLMGEADPQAPEPGKLRILVIEDSATFRNSVKEVLESAEYQVIEAETGEAGLRQAARSRPAAILVDGLLPDIDGATVIQRLRLDPALRATPCLLLTASLTKEQELKALAAGADGCLKKDQGAGVLLARIAGVVRTDGSTQRAGAPASLFGPKKVLAVDDSETYLQALAAELRADSYEIITARSGEEALELLEVETVDCILLDLIMPGLTGQETCQRIRQSAGWREIPILLLTAREDRETMLGGINAGADDYILKSSDFEIVRARVRAQLRRKHFESENRRICDELYQKEREASQERTGRILAEHRAALLEALDLKAKEVRESEERLARIVDTIADAILIVDTSGRIVFANATSEKLFRVKREVIMARSHDDPAWKLTTAGGAPFPREELPCARVLKTREAVYNVEADMELPDATRIVVSINSAPIKNSAGEILEMITSFSNITQRKEVENMKNDFVSTVSHELRTPLSSMRGFTFLLLNKSFNAGKQREFLTIIHNETIRLSNLINDFLDIQRMESGRQQYVFASVDLASLIRQASALFNQDDVKHRLVVQISDSLPPIWADPEKILQILSNLLSNAFKYSPKGGQVTIEARQAESQVEVSISDQGLGIAQKDLPNLFTKFYRVNTSETRGINGTGLGLAIVKEIITAHQGKIWVKTEAGKGSSFLFRLPVASKTGLYVY